MEVRRIVAGEVEGYREMRLRALREAPYAFGSTLEQALARSLEEWREFVERAATSQELALFVLDRGDGHLAGSAAAIDEGGPEPAVIQMWLDEDLRGNGWAEALLGAAEGYLRQRGFDVCALWVAEANPRARRFYQRVGYVETGDTADNGRGERELRMRRVFVQH